MQNPPQFPSSQLVIVPKPVALREMGVSLCEDIANLDDRGTDGVNHAAELYIQQQ